MAFKKTQEEVVKTSQEAPVSDFYGYLPFDLRKSQKQFLEAFTTSEDNFCLLGQAGTGKSTIMEVLRNYYGDEMIIMGSTGISNQLLGGEGTAHKIMSLPVDFSGDLTGDSVNPTTQGIFGGSDLVKIIVIEEAFMLNPDNLMYIKKRIDRYNRSSGKRKARNIRLLMVGDPLQLPPVYTKGLQKRMTAKHGSHLMFKSDIWKEFDFKTMMLREVNRQQEKVMLSMLDVLRYGKEERYDKMLAYINKNYIATEADYLNSDKLLIGSTNKTVSLANERALAAMGKPIGQYDAVLRGKFDKADCPADDSIYLCQGLPVITLVNHPEGQYSNGSSGVVEEMTEEGVWVLFDGDMDATFVNIHSFLNEELYVEKDVVQKDGTIKDEKKKRLIGTYTQVPLKAASAFTIHRSQGRTFSKDGVIDLGNDYLYKNMGDFGTHSFYVALSRFTDLKHVKFSQKVTKDMIKVCRETVNWWKEVEAEMEKLD